MILRGDRVNIIQNSFKIKSEQNIVEKLKEPQIEQKIYDLNYTKKIIDKLLLTANQEANLILETSKAQADDKAKSILISAQNDADKIKKDAYDVGYKEGYEEALKKHESHFEYVRNNILSSINELIEKQDNFMENLNKNVIDLSLTISSKIMHTKIMQDNKVLLPLIEDAISKKMKSDTICLTISSSVKEIINDIEENMNVDKLFKDKEFKVNFKDVDEGTILVHGDNEVLDASIESQLKKLSMLFMSR